MSTLRSLITGSLRLLNVNQSGEAPSDDEIESGVQALNGILDSWSTERLFIYTVKPTKFNLVSGKQDYTLGPGGDFDILRPLSIQQASLTLNSSVIAPSSNSFDLPLALLPTDQYARIKLKSMSSSYPQAIYDDGGSPLRTLSVWPVPSEAAVLTLWLWAPLIETTDLDEEFDLPPGYERALRFTLAIELSSEFGKDITPSMAQIATSSVSKIKRLNAANSVPLMEPTNSFGTGGFSWVTGGLI